MIATAVLVLVGLAGTGLAGFATLARAGGPRLALAIGGGVLAVLGVAAAAALAPFPSALIGLCGLLPLLRGLGRLSSVRFRSEEPPSTAALVRSALADPATAYLPVVATRAGSEVLEASVLVIVVGVLAALAATRVARVDRLARVGAALAPWTLMAIGAVLLVDGGAFSWLLRPIAERLR